MTRNIQRVAIDSGGTFTDFVVLYCDGTRERFKLPSTPHDPGEAIYSGLKGLAGNPRDPVLHGTTVATNALLERKGARIGLVTSKGFRDVHELRRQHRENLFALEPTAFPSLIAKEDVFEIDLRPRAHEQFNFDAAKPVIEHFVDSLSQEFQRFDVVVVSLIHGYANIDLEQAVAKAIQGKFQGLEVQSAAALVPFSREYERVETALANAFVQPAMQRYLGGLKSRYPAAWAIMGSAGGLMTLRDAMDEPVRTAISGPAGGVAAAQAILAQVGAKAALTLDMGGTSTDIAFVTADDLGQLEGNVGSRPLRLPMLPIDTIGAGGGSIARRDEAGILTVGPESAGASPGPACYGQSDELLPTLTDAHVCLGHIESLLGGSFSLHRGRAIEALASLRSERQETVEAVAQSMIQIANANIVKAVRGLASHSAVRLDDAVLFAFGGAGGLHACDIAERLNISRVYFPEEPGVFSAEGILDASFLHWEAQALHRPIPKDSELAPVISLIYERAQKLLSQNHPGYDPACVSETLVFDCHYEGQSHTLPVTLNGGLSAPDLHSAIESAFHEAHRDLYGYAMEGATTVLLANIRLKTVYSAWASKVSPESRASAKREIGPRTISSYGSTLKLEQGWQAERLSDGGYMCTRVKTDKSQQVPPLEAYRLELVSSAEEMGATLKRAAFSPNIKERRDYSCAVFSADGELLAQAAHIPVHLGSQSESVRAVIASKLYGPKQSVILNDPYAGGTHLPDITLVTPVYHDGQVVFFVASRAHHADVGGPYPGSMPVPMDLDGSPVTLTIEDEGICLAPTVMNDSARQRIAAASRTPEERIGDLKAQEAANLAGVRRLEALIEARGDSIASLNESLLQFGQDQARALIETFPNGTFYAEEVLEDDGHGQSVTIRLSLTRQMDRLNFDFSESDNQTGSSLNAVKAVTTACVYYALKVLGGPRLPANEGVLRQLVLQTRSGSVCDAVFPAAVSSGNVETSQRIVDVIFGAFRQALPGRIPAQSCGSMNNIILKGTLPDGSTFVHYETHGGGAGAGPSHNGLSGVHSHMTNTLNTPIEELELSYPLEIEDYSLVEGPSATNSSATFQGGAGLRRGYKFLCEGEVTFIGERHSIPPSNASGMRNPAKCAKHLVKRRDGSTQAMPSKGRSKMNAGDVMILETASGGDWDRES